MVALPEPPVSSKAPGVVPAIRYTEQDFADLERLRLWPQVWLHAAAVDQLGAPGQWVPVTLGPGDVVLTRDGDGCIRAFYNVCRHRGRPLVDGCGHGAVLRCAYHGWQWRLDGTLAALTLPDNDERRAQCSTLGMLPLACEVWGGQVWVHAGTPEQSVRAWLGPAAEDLERYDLADFFLHEAVSIAVPCNWKTACDAFQESYHLPSVHPYLAGAVNDGAAPIVLHGWHSLQTIAFAQPAPRAGAAVRPELEALLQQWSIDPAELQGDPTAAPALVRRSLRARGAPYAELDDDQLTGSRNWYLFPSLTFSATPVQLMLHRYRPGPTAAECWLDQLIFLRKSRETPPEQAPQLRPVAATTAMDQRVGGQVLTDDIRNLVAAQRGLATMAHLPPPHHALTLAQPDRRIWHMHVCLEVWLGPLPDRWQVQLGQS